MAKPTKATVLAQTTRAALFALADTNDAQCSELENCKRCKNAQRCINCTDLKDCEDCTNSSDLTNCRRCDRCSELKNSSDCTDCHGSDANPSANVYGCRDCVFVERSFFLVGQRGTAEIPIRNRFMGLQFTAAEMDLLLALPLT